MARRTLGWTGAALGFVAGYFAIGAALPERGAAAQAVTRHAAADAGDESGETPELAPIAIEASSETPDAERAADTAREAAASDGDAIADAEATGAVIFGVVRDMDGDPLPGAWVGTTVASGDRVGGKADDRGLYALGPLPPERWTITSYERYHHEVTATIDIAPDAREIRHDFVMRKKQVVRVRLVTSEGEPALPALAESTPALFRLQLVPVATREKPGATFTEVTGSLNNKFGIGSYGQPGFLAPDAKDADEYGSVTLDEPGPAWISLVASHQVLETQRLAVDTEVVTFTLDPEDIDALGARIQMTIVDAESGTPLAAKASVGDDPFVNGETRVDSDPTTGSLVLADALPGKKWLIVDAPGRAPVKREIDVRRGETLELGRIVMHAPIEIAGTVRDADGKPYEAVVRWGTIDESTGRVSWAKQTSTRSDAEGRFRIGRLEPALYAVSAPGLPTRDARPQDPRLASTVVQVDTRSGPPDDVALVLHSTSRITLVTGRCAEPYPTAVALDGDGLPARSIWIGRWGAEATLDLIDGTYALVVERDGEELERRELVVDGEAQRIELAIPDSDR